MLGNKPPFVFHSFCLSIFHSIDKSESRDQPSSLAILSDTRHTSYRPALISLSMNNTAIMARIRSKFHEGRIPSPCIEFILNQPFRSSEEVEQNLMSCSFTSRSCINQGAGIKTLSMQKEANIESMVERGADRASISIGWKISNFMSAPKVDSTSMPLACASSFNWYSTWVLILTSYCRSGFWFLRHGKWLLHPLLFIYSWNYKREDFDIEINCC